ncbi:GH92 family glycosyl hydrolase [Lactobacillus sp. YT155]|uniref:GH92 family glycosyl hydrolase n=1 Tax=Lactobacillus sp. YT155 TaxID=3060955 RepID=UPI00265F564B|nr:GH92 family glycosyl hydrolase [Lactobacillus sp. YT155]MDO1605849.1 GH92 family glycosyl hydrolase [Lactobacillus sp. YT155]
MLINSIDTRQGTNNNMYFSNGNCLPYTGVPFGMNYFCPQTNSDNQWWFNPLENMFQGFRLTHQPSPWMEDFSSFLLLPFSGDLNKYDFESVQTSYNPKQSVFQPNTLKIIESKYQVTSQLIPSCYGGLLHLDNSSTQELGLLMYIPGKYQVTKNSKKSISGYLSNYKESEDPDFKFFFNFSFSSEFTIENISQEEYGIFKIIFKNYNDQTIKFGTSYISEEQAKFNLSKEIDWSLQDYLKNGEDAWEDQLNKITINHHDSTQVSTFYHNLYRVFLFPQKFYEVDKDGNSIHFDTFNRKIRRGKLYTNNGFWDTYKTVYPLFSLIAQDQYEEILEGILNSYKETGFLPKWLSPDERGLMPGTLVDAVIADAATKDIGRKFLPELFKAMKKTATVESKKTNYGRSGTKDYLKYGFVPMDYDESVNHTLDYCYSDFCISQVAYILNEMKDFEYYRTQSLNYRNIFDPESKFMVAKNRKNQLRDNFNPYEWGTDYTEGSAWQNSYSVYHDFAGLVQLFGGTESFSQRLIELCNQSPVFGVGKYNREIHEMSEMAAVELGQLAISNQPSFHIPYLFNYIGKPEMAQPLLKQLTTIFFDDSVTGYPGDEDNGSMASWFIFSSLGFYPVTPGSKQYVVGMPIFDKVTIKLSSGKSLKISSTPNQEQQLFIDDITLNNKKYTNLYFNHDDLMRGGNIEFRLGIVPHPRNYSKDELPYSLSKIK